MQSIDDAAARFIQPAHEHFADGQFAGAFIDRSVRRFLRRLPPESFPGK